MTAAERVRAIRAIRAAIAHLNDAIDEVVPGSAFHTDLLEVRDIATGALSRLGAPCPR